MKIGDRVKMELACIGKYRELSVNRGPSEKVGPSENGACLLRQVQGTKYRELSVNRGPSENIGLSGNGACLCLSTGN